MAASRLYTLLGVLLILLTSASARVELGDRVEIHQPDGNASINITQRITLNNLSVYQDTTRFSDSNFTVTGDTSDPIDVRLWHYNASSPVGEYPANFSTNTTAANNVTFQFTGFTQSSLYEAFEDNTLIKRTESTATGVYSFFYDSFSGVFQEFGVKNIETRPPAITAVEYLDNRRTSTTRLTLSIDDKGESDIKSYYGAGTLLKFTNSTLQLQRALPLTGTYNVSDTKGRTTADVFLNFSTTESGFIEDNYQHNLSYQQGNKTVSAWNTGIRTVDYNRTFQDYGTPLTATTWTDTIPADGSKQFTGVWSGDWLNESQDAFNTPETVTFDVNYTGWRHLTVNESKNLSWTDVDTTGFVDSPAKCNQINNSKIGISALENASQTVGFTCDPGSSGTPVLTVVNKSDSKDRVWYNTTATVTTEKTSNARFKWNISESNLKTPNDRNGGSLEAYADGNQINVSVADVGDTIVITIGRNHTDSSLHSGDHPLSLTYTLGGDGDSDSSGSGSSGVSPAGSGETIIEVNDSYAWRVTAAGTSTRTNFSFIGFPGRHINVDLLVENQGTQNVTIQAQCRAGGRICTWVNLSQQRIELGPKSTQVVEVSATIPENASKKRYAFDIRFTDPSFTPGQSSDGGYADIPFVITISPLADVLFEAWQAVATTFGKLVQWTTVAGVSVPFLVLPLVPSVIVFVAERAISDKGGSILTLHILSALGVFLLLTAAIPK